MLLYDVGLISVGRLPRRRQRRSGAANQIEVEGNDSESSPLVGVAVAFG